MATREQLYQALRNADAVGDVDAAKKLAAYISALPSDVATSPRQDGPKFDAAKAGKQVLADMNWGEKALVNIGAGMDNLVQGAKQLFGSGMSDEQLREKRAFDSAAADETTGGKLLQIGGEVAPTMLMPAGAFVRGGGAALKAGGTLARTLSGAQPVARALPVVANAIPRLGTGAAIADSAMAGTALAALNPVTDEESRFDNMLMGGVGGALFPGLIAGGRGIHNAFSKSGAEQRAASKLASGLGDDATKIRNAVADINTYFPKGAENIPMSTATITQNPSLLLAERASRAKDPASWTQFDITQNRAVWDNVVRGTENAGQLGRLRETRQGNWNESTSKAFENFKPKKFSHEMNAFYDNIDQALRSPAGQNEMRPVLTEIKRQMDDLGPQFGPEHMARLRARMQGMIKGTPGDPFASAPKSDPYFISLKTEIDRILNSSTGSKWNKAVQGYAKDSGPVTAARSSEAIKGAFVTPEGVFRKTDVGGVPSVTQAGLRQALTQFGENNFGNTLAPDSRTILDATLGALQRRDALQTVKGSGTGGGGSNTLMDFIAAGANVDHHGLAGMALSKVKNFSSDRTRAALDEALRNPDAFVALMERKLASGAPLTRVEEHTLNLIRGAGGGSLAVATQE